MKITIISHYPPVEGGISKYTQQLVTLLKKEKIDVTVITVDSFKDSLHILSEISKEKPDIIRLEFSISMYRLSALSIFTQLFILKKNNNFKIAVNFHEVKRDTDFLNKLGIFFYRSINPLFDYVSVHTKEARHILISKCYYNSKKIRVINHGLYLPNKKNIDNKTLKNKKKIILFFGYIHIHKGIEVLLDSYKKLLVDNPSFANTTQLIIAGSIRKRKGFFKLFEYFDNRYYKSLLEKTNNLNIEKNTSFLGHIHDKDVENLIESAYIITLPYTSTEQSGVLNQVLPFKNPIIASNIGGLRETLNKAGILVKPENIDEMSKQISKLIKDKNYYKHIVNNYKLLIKSLNPTDAIKKQIEFYNT